jgi:hypothetical protein
MWLGLVHIPHAETEDGEDTVLLLAWEAGRDRPLTVGGPRHAVAQMARTLREAAQHAPLLPPRCDACRTPLDLPLN